MNGRFYEFGIAPLELFTLRKLRHELLANAVGKTLEIGVGTGLNFEFYAHLEDVTGIDPDEDMLSTARKKEQRPPRLLVADAQDLPFQDNEFDTVVATLVFCTVPDPAKAINEVQRVLKRDGKLLLLEHVRRNTPIAGKLLDLMTPAWKHVAGGCHLNRDPLPLLLNEGFVVEDSEVLWKGLGRIMVLRRP